MTKNDLSLYSGLKDRLLETFKKSPLRKQALLDLKWFLKQAKKAKSQTRVEWFRNHYNIRIRNKVYLQKDITETICNVACNRALTLYKRKKYVRKLQRVKNYDELTEIKSKILVALGFEK